MQHQLEKDSPFPRARARQCLRCPVPCAFSPETRAARKCNREAHCGDYPILARYRLLRIRDALADCDNKRSRSQRKRARRAGTFPIAAADRYLCLPRRTADSDVQFANSESRSIPPTRKRTCRRFPEREERGLSLMTSGSLRFNRVEECGDSRCASQSQKHQPEAIG